MDAKRFDALVRSWGRRSRRQGVQFLTGLVLGGLVTPFGTQPTAAKPKKTPKKKKKKQRCGGGCPKGFYCCSGDGFADRCCPYLLGQCCPFGCCVLDPNMVCGASESAPCVYVTAD